MSNRSKSSNALNRRTLLKGAAGVVGLAAGSGAITGFPYVRSAEPKVLRPIPQVWAPLNRERINDTSLVGRTNAVGSNVAGLRTGWQAPGTGGNAM